MKKAWAVRMAASAVAVLAVAAGAVWYHEQPGRYPVRFGEVVPGRIYRGGQPTASQIKQLAMEKGIKTTVNLRSPGRQQTDHNYGDEKLFAEQNGIRFISIPFQSPPTDENIRQLLDVLDDEGNYPIYVHCSRGVERSGGAVAVYRMERMGWSPKQALNEMLEYDFQEKIHHDASQLDMLVFVASYKTKYPASTKKD